MKCEICKAEMPVEWDMKVCLRCEELIADAMAEREWEIRKEERFEYSEKEED